MRPATGIALTMALRMLIGCEPGPADSCHAVDGPIAAGEWYADGGIYLNVSRAGAGSIVNCYAEGVVADASAADGNVSWHFDWVYFADGSTAPGTFEGVACADSITGVFDFGLEYELRREKGANCCGCE